jgi:hypothetical protein
MEGLYVELALAPPRPQEVCPHYNFSPPYILNTAGVDHFTIMG